MLIYLRVIIGSKFQYAFISILIFHFISISMLWNFYPLARLHIFQHMPVFMGQVDSKDISRVNCLFFNKSKLYYMEKHFNDFTVLTWLTIYTDCTDLNQYKSIFLQTSVKRLGLTSQMHPTGDQLHEIFRPIDWEHPRFSIFPLWQFSGFQKKFWVFRISKIFEFVWSLTSCVHKMKMVGKYRKMRKIFNIL